eukprot:6203610-Pleurochrysis_carterae.AAC.1
MDEEIAVLYRNNTLEVNDGETVRCGVKCCLVLAACRGMQGQGAAASLSRECWNSTAAAGRLSR